MLAQTDEKGQMIDSTSRRSSAPADDSREALPVEAKEDVESMKSGTGPDDHHKLELHRTLTRTSTRPYSAERFDVEKTLQAERTQSIVLAPTKTADGTILVDWYTTDDPANPQNWAGPKKSFVLFQLCMYSFAAYGASSMYVPGIQGVMEEFHVGTAPGALGLAIYVIGYGVGPLLFAPMSEIAAIGRNWVYAPTFFLFVMLGIGTALAPNYGGLLVLRFLTGLFSSPAVANGGASIGDLVRSRLDHTSKAVD